jgi:cytochrome P450
VVLINAWCDLLYFFPLCSQPLVRAILHDPVRYPEPDSFKPERFINPDGSAREDPVLATIFGFGKRLCPGRHLADAVMFIVIASFLSVFNIKDDGTDGGPDKYPFTGGGVRCAHRVSLVVQETRRLDCHQKICQTIIGDDQA